MSTGVRVESAYFAEPLHTNIERIHELFRNKQIQFYALGIGSDPEAQHDFQALANMDGLGSFLPLGDENAFIDTLTNKLNEERKEHVDGAGVVINILDDKTPETEVAASELDARYLERHNLTPDMIESLRNRRILTGWFDIDDGDDRAMVCVYLTRDALEDVIQQLRSLLETGDNLEMQKKIVEPYVGTKESLAGVRSTNDLVRLIKDLPIPPEVLNRIIEMSNVDFTNSVRNRINTVTKLLYVDEVYSEYGEGWIPLDLLPGSVNRGE
jgi:hypothetical protein